MEELSVQEDIESQHELIKDVAGIVFIGPRIVSSFQFRLILFITAGGSSGINATIQTFVLAMLCFRDVQVKAQEELDRVIGRDRLPDFNDELDLPYLGALLKEVYR